VKKAFVIRHVPFEDLGNLSPVLSARGYRIYSVDAGTFDFAGIDPQEPDLWVSLGGPISANDTEIFPFLREEATLMKTRVQHDLPTLGICLGAQILARAFGARVFPAAKKELGWKRVALTAAGNRSALRYLDTPVLHWHGENFDLPPNALSLAHTELCPHQAFQLGKRTLALQFHPEATVKGLENWFIGHIGEIVSTPTVDVSSLRSQTKSFGPSLEEAARHFWNAWLDEVE